MITEPIYIPTPLMTQISKRIFEQKNPLAFAIADFGEGPILTYQGYHTRLSTVSINLRQGDQHIEFSHLSQPPYFIAVAQDSPQQPVFVVLYSSESTPMLEHGVDDGLIGQVFAFGESQDGARRTLAHALCLPKCSQVFATRGFKYSILLEEHPELCNHLLLCGEMIDFLFRQGIIGDTYG